MKDEIKYCKKCKTKQIHYWKLDKKNNFLKLKCMECGKIAKQKDWVDKYA